MERNTENLERNEAANGINGSDGDHEVDDWNEKQIGFLAGALLSRVTARKEATGAVQHAPVARHAQTARAVGRKAASNEKRGGQPGFRVSDFPSQQASEATGCPVREVGSVIDRTAGYSLVLPKFR
ncbi:hypothetical protein ACTJJ7_20115 [Phyllobacterium sp. 22229]|uniref:hypothetical protein n=1 Tax=Phyllobacterium sp. 22229 TaxID=3453895 RepID=UPI003F850622